MTSSQTQVGFGWAKTGWVVQPAHGAMAFDVVYALGRGGQEWPVRRMG
jgi:hypothetical protein